VRPVTERIAATAATGPAAVASTLPRRAAADAHAPGADAEPATPPPRAAADGPGRGAPDPSGVTGSLVDVFA
jgi:hypothetical protein